MLSARRRFPSYPSAYDTGSHYSITAIVARILPLKISSLCMDAPSEELSSGGIHFPPYFLIYVVRPSSPPLAGRSSSSGSVKLRCHSVSCVCLSAWRLCESVHDSRIGYHSVGSPIEMVLADGMAISQRKAATRFSTRNSPHLLFFKPQPGPVLNFRCHRGS